MGNKQAEARRRRQVTEIFTWVQCFCTYTSVMSGGSPEAVPELLAYLVTITRMSQDFMGLAWVRYDSAFCSTSSHNCQQTVVTSEPITLLNLFYGAGSAFNAV